MSDVEFGHKLNIADYSLFVDHQVSNKKRKEKITGTKECNNHHRFTKYLKLCKEKKMIKYHWKALIIDDQIEFIEFYICLY